MHKQLLGLVAAMMALALLAAAQEQDALMRWGDVTLDKLVPFLPDASVWGFIPELPGQASDFKAWANDTPHLYPALLVHKNWYFSDPKLYREIDDTRTKKAALREEMNTAVDQFEKIHGDEERALEKAHNAELDAATKKAQALFQQGKYEEGKKVIDSVKPLHYAPLEAMGAEFEKLQKELYDRENDLLAKRRSVSFRIYTNRTPSTTAFANPSKPSGRVAGRTLYLQDRGTMDMGGGRKGSLVDFAVYLGPANFQNPDAAADKRERAVKCIVVWAWIESRPDTILADEALVKKVLEKIDYEGLAKLVEP